MTMKTGIIRAIILIAILLTRLPGIAALAASTENPLDPPPSTVVDAAHGACSRYASYGHDYLQHKPGDEPLPPVPTGPEPYRPSDAAMLGLYNTYNLRGSGELLGRYADDVEGRHASTRRYSDAQCRVLVPAYALAKVVLVLNVPPLDVTLHGLIDRCLTDGVIHLCFRRSLLSIPARCDLPASASHAMGWCTKPDTTDPLASEIEHLRSTGTDEVGHGSSFQPIDPDTGDF